MIPLLLSIRLARTRTIVRQFTAVAVLGLLTAACTAAPEQLLAGADPSDPSVHVSSTSYRPVIGGYASLRPVAPTPWREQNDRAAPARKQ